MGTDVDHMRKAMMDEGRVVELNNQAKHAVTNGWSRSRVHLILDYVEVRGVMQSTAHDLYYLDPIDSLL